MKIIISLFLVLVLNACASKSVLKQDSATCHVDSKLSGGSTYYIGVDDVLEVNVWRNPELSVSVPVRPDGKITVPLIGDVQAGGKVPMEVAGDINEKLMKYIREPQVTVILTELRSHEFISRIRVTGAVQSPVSLPYRQGMTVLDAVLQAGGLNEFASENGGLLFREKENSIEEYNLYLSDILYSGELETNCKLMPGDIISIPERLF
jgi:polysaccharide export outer membrane protein